MLIFTAHSPDNSFMGFVVEQHLNDTFAEDIPRSDMAVVYGKNDYMWQVGLTLCLLMDSSF